MLNNNLELAPLILFQHIPSVARTLLKKERHVENTIIPPAKIWSSWLDVIE